MGAGPKVGRQEAASGEPSTICKVNMSDVAIPPHSARRAQQAAAMTAGRTRSRMLLGDSALSPSGISSAISAAGRRLASSSNSAAAIACSYSLAGDAMSASNSRHGKRVPSLRATSPVRGTDQPLLRRPPPSPQPSGSQRPPQLTPQFLLAAGLEAVTGVLAALAENGRQLQLSLGQHRRRVPASSGGFGEVGCPPVRLCVRIRVLCVRILCTSPIVT